MGGVGGWGGVLIILDLDKDQVLFIPLCNWCGEGIEVLAKQVEKHEARDEVIVT